MSPPKPYCDQHGETCATLHRIEQSVARTEAMLEALDERLTWRLLLLERIVFGGCGLILLAVVGAILATVLR